MEFPEEFEREFMKRTLSLVKTYTGPKDATLLLNCLVGLLIVPKETAIDRIPLEPLSSLLKWGITPSSIVAFGVSKGKRPQPDTIRGLVHSLRNSIAHFNITPQQENHQVIAFRFQDANGFDATIKVSEMREFVERLALHLNIT